MNPAPHAAPHKTAAPPAPWGSPPTPLLPRWFIKELCSVPLPALLVQATSHSTGPKPRPQRVGDLPRFWIHRSTPVCNDTLKALPALAGQRRIPSHHTILPAGIDTERLWECPLQARTRSCLQRAFLQKKLREDQITTVGQVLTLPNFGITSLLDLMCVVEAGVGNGFLLPTPENGAAAATPPQPSDHPPKPATAPRPPEPERITPDAWSSATGLLKRILSAAAEFRGAHTLADALDVDLRGLASTLGIVDDLGEIRLSDLTDGSTLTQEALTAIVELLGAEDLSEVEHLILKQRTLAEQPQTLEELGRRTKLSRERIRQLEKSIGHTIESTVSPRLRLIADLIRHQIDPIVTESKLDEQILPTFSDTSSLDDAGAAIDIARRMLRTGLGYSCVDGLWLNKDATALLDRLRSAAHRLADDVGLVEEDDLRAHLPNEAWHKHWQVLVDRCNLHRLNGHLSLRNTQKARTKAALLAIGRPATKDEIAELSGLNSKQAGSQLSLLPGVIRADKTRWGLAEWIDDEYDGIADEIIQRIREDCGATRLARLLEELPRQFGVSESSVRAYVGTPRFVLKDSYVSLADRSSIVLRHLDDVIDGHTRAGSPYWTFEVEDRYFDGYSLVSLPPEIAQALGCEPDGGKRVRVSSPLGCRQLSVRWPLTSLTGASLGYLSDPLRGLDVGAGDRVRLVLEQSGQVSLQHDDQPGTRPQSRAADRTDGESTPERGPTERSQELLERMKNRRRLL